MKRLPALLYLALTVAAGLASRRAGAWVPAELGDALYATMWCWLLRLGAPHAPAWMVAVAAFGVCAAIECSQLWRAPALEALRATALGGLVLGHGFLWGDLLAYALGAALGPVLEHPLAARAARRLGG